MRLGRFSFRRTCRQRPYGIGHVARSNYERAWSKEELIVLLSPSSNHASMHHDYKRPKRGVTGGRLFHFKDHPVRKIAVKFCYSGLAHQIDPTPLPTLESEPLFQACAKARLENAGTGLDRRRCERCWTGCLALGEERAPGQPRETNLGA